MSKSVPNDIVKIISSLASEDSIKILLACEKGIEKSTEVIKKLGLTQKVYYTWLTKLIEAGLVEKTKDSYKVTILGKYCIRLVKMFANFLEEKDELIMIDKIVDLENALNTEGGELFAVFRSKLLKSVKLHEIYEIEVITDYDTFINEVIKLIDSAEKSVYVASSRVDFRVVESVLRAIKKNLNVYFLSEKTSEDFNIRLLSFLLNPSLRSVVLNLVRSIGSLERVNFRELSNINCCFVIVDENVMIVELLPIKYLNFSFAFKLEDENICRLFIEAFNSLYEKGKEDSRVLFLKKHFSHLLPRRENGTD